MLLTKEDRVRFAAYLIQDAESAEMIAKQMEKIPGSPIAQLAAQNMELAKASRIVAERLRGGEDW
jgi:hypothetical protein